MTNVEPQFQHITRLIGEARQRAFLAVNRELVQLYWQIGQYVSQQVTSESWGKSVVKELAEYIRQTEPQLSGFSSQNIWRMKQFYETYEAYPQLTPLLNEVSWTNHLLVLPCSSPEEREFYLRLAARERYSKRELSRQITSSYYERVMLGTQKLAPLVRELPQSLTDSLKDTYVLEFLQLPELHLEGELRKRISQNITRFLLEFGRDFAFIGEEYPLQVGDQDFRIDLLFYNRTMNCLVAIELKVERFKPEHLGQLNFYLEALDRDVRKPHENPSIGILLCKGKNDTVVEYALNRSLSPTLVADYQTKLPDKRLLQAKWQEILDTLTEEAEGANPENSVV